MQLHYSYNYIIMLYTPTRALVILVANSKESLFSIVV